MEDARGRSVDRPRRRQKLGDAFVYGMIIGKVVDEIRKDC
jgi:hypothetical protein